MAQVQTTFAVTPSSNMMRFRAFSDRDLRSPDIPLREVLCTIVTGAIPLTGVGDNQNIVIRVDLPVGQAYRCVEANLRLSAAAGVDFGFPSSFEGRFRNQGATEAMVQGQSLVSLIEFHAFGDVVQGSDIEGKYYNMVDKPGMLWSPMTPDDNVSLHCEAFNTTANDSAYVMDFFARFWEYQIGRADEWSINRVIPTVD